MPGASCGRGASAAASSAAPSGSQGGSAQRSSSATAVGCWERKRSLVRYTPVDRRSRRFLRAPSACSAGAAQRRDARVARRERDAPAARRARRLQARRAAPQPTQRGARLRLRAPPRASRAGAPAAPPQQPPAPRRGPAPALLQAQAQASLPTRHSMPRHHRRRTRRRRAAQPPARARRRRRPAARTTTQRPWRAHEARALAQHVKSDAPCSAVCAARRGDGEARAAAAAPRSGRSADAGVGAPLLRREPMSHHAMRAAKSDLCRRLISRRVCINPVGRVYR